ncbi:MAG: TOMM precursor leader peptide-binding protein [Bacteroidota bacterium]
MQQAYFQTSPYFTFSKNASNDLMVTGQGTGQIITDPVQRILLEILMDKSQSLNDVLFHPAIPQGTHPLQLVKYLNAYKQHQLILSGENAEEIESPDLHVKPYSASHHALSNSYQIVELETSDFQQVWQTYNRKQSPETNSLTIVIANDFLDNRIEQIHQQMMRQKKSWMLFKPFGNQVMISPVFNADQGACWKSMAQRMRLHRPLTQIEGFEIIAKEKPFYTSKSLEVAIQFLVDTIESKEDLNSYLHAYDLASGQATKHWVVKKSNELSDVPNSDIEPVDITQLLFSDEPIVSKAGGFRTLTAKETFEKYQHHISPVTGIISEIEPYRGSEYSQLHNFTSGRNLALQSKSMFWLNNHRRSCSGGKGKSEQQAKTGALCEAIERYSMMHHGQPAILRSTLKDLGDKGIHPNTCMNFSQEQFAQREETNENSTAFYSLVPVEFDENASVDWTRVYGLTHQEERYLPSTFCYAQYPGQDERNMIAYPDSNGCAAGNSHAEAALQGTLELIERDAAAIWWYNQIRRPKVDLKSLANEYIKEMLDFYAENGRSLEVLDITTDIGIPTFVAVSHKTDTGKSILFGFGCHIDAAVAVERAVIELNQLLPITLGDEPVDMDLRIKNWLDEESVTDNIYLSASDEIIHIQDKYPGQSFSNLNEVLQYLTAQFQKQSLDLYLLDLTQQDIGMPVVKMIAPNLRHYWRRTGPGRLYEVPVKMGWLSEPKTEDQLNQHSIVI